MKHLPLAALAVALVAAWPAAAQVAWSVTGSYSPASPTPSQTVDRQLTITLDAGSDPVTCTDLARDFRGAAEYASGHEYSISFAGWRANLRAACEAADADNTLEAGDSFTFTLATLTPPGGGASETAHGLDVAVAPPGKALEQLTGSFTVAASASGDLLTVSLDPKVSGCTQTACPLVVEADGANAGLGKGDVTLRYRASGGAWQSSGIFWPIVVPVSYTTSGSLVVPLSDIDAYQYARNVVGLTPGTAYEFEVTANGQTSTTTLTTAALPSASARIAAADSSVVVSTAAELQAAINDADNHAAGGHVIRLATAVFDVSGSELDSGFGNLVSTAGNEIVITADTDTCPLDAVRSALATTGTVQAAENALYDNGDPATGNPLCPIIDAGDSQATSLRLKQAEHVHVHGIALANSYQIVTNFSNPGVDVVWTDNVMITTRADQTPLGLNDTETTLSAGAAVDVSASVFGVPITAHGFEAGNKLQITGTEHYDGTYTIHSVTADQVNLQYAGATAGSASSYTAETFDGTETVFYSGPDGEFACGSGEQCLALATSGTGYAENNVLVGPFNFGKALSGTSSRGLSLDSGMEGRWNTIAGFGDGMKVGTFGSTLHHNEILWVADDGVELEDVVRNVTAHDNLFTNVGRALAFAECYAGPCVAARNIVWNAQVPIKAKVRQDQTAGFHALNNTLLMSFSEWMDFSTYAENATVANNVFIGNGLANGRSERRTLYATRFFDTMTLDYNAWANSGGFQMTWRTSDSAFSQVVAEDSFAAWQTRMNGLDLGGGNTVTQSQNSITLEVGSNGRTDTDPSDNTYQDPIFVGEASGPAADTGQVVLDLGQGSYTSRRVVANQAAADWSDWFEPTGALVDSGTNLYSQWTASYAGTAPDLGAVEAGQTMPRYGARSPSTVSTGYNVVDQVAGGTGFGWDGAGVMASFEVRRIGGTGDLTATSYTLFGAGVMAEEQLRGETPTYDAVNTASPAGATIDNTAESMCELIYRNLSSADRTAWDNGTLGIGAGVGCGRYDAGANTMIRWVGWAFDPVEGEAYIVGGGHNDGGDSSVYSYDFDAPDASSLWARRTNPTARVTVADWSECDSQGWTGPSYPPAHTYDMPVWLPPVGKVMQNGGGMACGGANGLDGVYFLWDRANVSNPTQGYERIFDTDKGLTNVTRNQGGLTGWVAEADTAIYHNGGESYGYHPATDTWTGPVPRGGHFPVGDMICLPGADMASGNPTCISLDESVSVGGQGLMAMEVNAGTTPATPGAYHECVEEVPGSGTQDGIDPRYAGAAYDSDQKRVYWWNGDSQMLSLPVSEIDGCVDGSPGTPFKTTASFTTHDLTGSVIPDYTTCDTGAGQGTRIYSKFEYMGQGLFVGMGCGEDGAWVMKR